jgi:hypothetical protein
MMMNTIKFNTMMKTMEKLMERMTMRNKPISQEQNDPPPRNLLTGEIDRPSTGRVELVRGFLNNPSHLEWTTLTSLTAPLAALRSRMETKEK